jgi:hypothetical protein
MMMDKVASNIGAEICTLTYQKSFVEKIAETNLMNSTYKDIKDAEAIVIVGKISHTLQILARTQQRKGKKLIIINDEKSDFNNFADVLLDDFPITDTIDKIFEHYSEDEERVREGEEEERRIMPIELDLPEKTLFLYNRNMLDELTIWKIWAFASMVCDFKKGSGVLPTSNLNNFMGLLKCEIQPGNPENSDFVILYGELPCEEQKKQMKHSKFIISVNTHLDEADPSHLLLPKASYLEIEGTAIANDGRISEFKNPKKSRFFNIILEGFKIAGLLDDNHANAEYWHQKALALTKEKIEKKEMTNQQLCNYLDSIKKAKS